MSTRPASFSDARQNPRKKKDFEALRESEEQFRTIANNLPQLAWMADKYGAIFWYNQRWFDYTGTTPEDMAAGGWEKALPPEQSERVHNKFKRCLRLGEMWEDTFPLRDGNGTYRWFLSQATPVRNAEGQLAHWLVTHTDISEIRKMEEQLLAEKDHALEAWEAKIRLQANLLEQARETKARLQENFLSRVSHELRTPLTAIYFFTTNLLDGILGDLTGPQHEQLELALTNVCQLKDMVSDLIDISRIDTHKIALELQYTNPKKLINEVLATCRTNAAAKRINLRSDLPENLPALWADSSRVRQILTNLIDNGIKFTPKGGAVTVSHRAMPGKDDFLCLTVSDTGCGIPPEKVEVVFDRLAQLESGSGTNRSGLGLGLYITRELVTVQGGRIWVESAVGRGSTFFVSLPLFSMDKQLAHIFTAENLSDGRVTLITVDVSAIEGGAQGDINFEIRRVLSLCIHPGQDLLLPAIGEGEPVASYFIVACTGAQGADIITHRISRDLKKFDSASKLKPVISSTTLLLAAGSPPVEQTREVSRQIERLIQTRLANGSSAGHFSKPVSSGESPAWPVPTKPANLTETSVDPAGRQRSQLH
jgi:PAS domain S-box-containing protein